MLFPCYIYRLKDVSRYCPAFSFVFMLISWFFRFYLTYLNLFLNLHKFPAHLLSLLKYCSLIHRSNQKALNEIRTAISTLKIFLKSLASINNRSDPNKLLRVILRYTDRIVQEEFLTFSNAVDIDFNTKKSVQFYNLTYKKVKGKVKYSLYYSSDSDVCENVQFIQAASHSVCTIMYTYLAFLLYQAQR